MLTVGNIFLIILMSFIQQKYLYKLYKPKNNFKIQFDINILLYMYVMQCN